jgi:homoserine dehydrogenase
LPDAQARGFAEADPTADVDGFDAAAKIAIMASIAFNSRVRMDQVTNEGIRTIRPTDLAAAKDMGYCVKLLAVANRTDAGIDVRVHPTMVPLSHPLASVSGVNNAVYVTGDFVGDAMFYGQGAGAGATASAVMGDVLEIARHVQAGVAPLVGCTCTDDLPIVPMGELISRYYIRFVVDDRSGVLAKTSAVFAKHGVERLFGRCSAARAKAAARSIWSTSPIRPAKPTCAAVIEDIKQLDGRCSWAAKSLRSFALQK